ncbi:MAG: hypothetical protein MHMPM18_005017, partial [Marteilia pararefringens]
LTNIDEFVPKFKELLDSSSNSATIVNFWNASQNPASSTLDNGEQLKLLINLNLKDFLLDLWIEDSDKLELLGNNSGDRSIERKYHSRYLKFDKRITEKFEAYR